MPQADGFIVYQLGPNYMDSIDIRLIINGNIRVFLQMPPIILRFAERVARSKRTIAIERIVFHSLVLQRM